MLPHPIRPRMEDALHSRSASAVGDGAFIVLTALDQIDHPADKLLGVIYAAKVMAETCGFSIGELFDQCEKREADCRFRQVNTLSTIRAYVDGEIKKKYR